MISGRVKVSDPTNVDPIRYEFLSLDNAEPNPGVPPSDNGILASSSAGLRSWLIPNQGLSVSGSNDLFVDETGVPIDTTNYNYSSSNVLSDVLADLDQNIANAVAGSLSTVATDATLTGDGTSGNPLSVESAGDAETFDGELPAYYLNYNNFTNTPTIGDGSITISGGNGLSGSSSFSINQSTNQTIALDNSDRGSSQNIFKNIAISGENTVVADTNNDTLTFVAGNAILITTDPTTDTITFDVDSESAGNDYVDSVIFDSNTGDITLTRTGTLTDLTANLDGRYIVSETPQNLFESIAVSGQSNIVADSSDDILTFVGGSNVIITTDPGTDSLTISSTDTNDYVTSGSFGTSDGILTLSRSDTVDVTVDLDGRYLLTTDTAADSNLLDGQNGAYYLNYGNFTNTPTIGNGTLTISSGSGLSGSGTFDANATTNNTVTIDHGDTSTQTSVNNSGNTVIQNIDLDDFGHVTSIGSFNLDSSFVNLSGDTMTGTLTLSGAPSGALDAATKKYVDDTAQGLQAKPADYVATISNLSATYDNGTSGVGATLTANTVGAFPVVDGYQLQVGETILVKDQTDPIENGSYELTTEGDGSTAWVLTRAEFMDETAEIPGAFEFVVNGDTLNSTGFVATVPDDFSIGSTTASSDSNFTSQGDIVWVQFSGSGAFTAGSGLDLNGTEFSHADTSSVSNLTATSRTYVNGLTFDTYGHVTGFTTSTETNDPVDTFVDTASFNDVDGILTIGRNDAVNITVDLDGRYLLQGDKAADSDLLDNQNGTYYLDYNNFTNTPTIGNGTLTVSGGAGLVGSGTFDANATTNNTVTINHSDTSSQISVDNSGRTYIQSITLDEFGHITGLSSATETVSDTNDYVSSMSFDTANGVLTLTRTDSGTVTENLDGRYLTSYTETDTLDSITDRGNSTTNSVSVGAVDVNSVTRYDSDSAIVSSTTETEIASFSSTTYGGAKLIVQITDTVSGERQVSELLLTHNGTNAFATEYGVVYTGAAPLVQFDTDIATGVVRLLASGTTSNSTEYKVTEILTLA